MLIVWKKILLKCSDYPNDLQSQCNPFQVSSGIYFQKQKKYSKIHMESQRTPNSQNDFEKE